ncbi:MAG: VCBS repeat-containing protein [Myxococcales bacterium]|nr:VCBS repeat-containing protein [Myxococcales bacterium]
MAGEVEACVCPDGAMALRACGAEGRFAACPCGADAGADRGRRRRRGATGRRRARRRRRRHQARRRCARRRRPGRRRSRRRRARRRADATPDAAAPDAAPDAAAPDPCLAAPCQNGGRCQNQPGGFTCDCQGTGYDGPTCARDVDECLAAPCQNGGRCQNQPGGFTCDCAGTGYDGPTCARDLDECLAAPCQNGGRCQNQPGGFTCDCQGTGYDGPTCARDVDECLAAPCQHGGRCQNQPGGFTCDCQGTGYDGPTCARDLDECLATPCQHGGRCQNQPGTFTCDCAATGYEGARCERDVDECLAAPCLNDGACVNEPGGFRCDCPEGFDGPRCAGALDECALGLDRCDPAVPCVDQPNGYLCDCRAHDRITVGRAGELAPNAGVAAGDLDGDGDLDLVARSDRFIFWYANDGAGGFSPSMPVSLGEPSRGALTLADIDGDGDLDVLSTGADVPFRVELALLRNALPVPFGRREFYAALPPPGATVLRAAELDGDGRDDILYADTAGSTGWVPAATGRAVALGALFVAPGAAVRWPLLTAVDLDGDGDLDVLGSNGYRENLGGGAFAAARVLLPAPAVPVGVGDFDGDGLQDLVAFTDALAWHRGLGAAVFEAARPLYTPATLCATMRDGTDGFETCDPAAQSLGPVLVYDADEDGDADIVALLRIDAAARPQPYLFANVGGGFVLAGLGPLGPDTGEVPRGDAFALVDVDGDGFDEVAEAPRRGGGVIEVWHPARACFSGR